MRSYRYEAARDTLKCALQDLRILARIWQVIHPATSRID